MTQKQQNHSFAGENNVGMKWKDELACTCDKKNRWKGLNNPTCSKVERNREADYEEYLESDGLPNTGTIA